MNPTASHDPDQDIARVLTALRQTTPAPHFEDRILQALNRPLEPTPLWRRWMPSHSFALAASAAALPILTVLALLLTHHHPALPTQAVISTGGAPLRRSGAIPVFRPPQNPTSTPPINSVILSDVPRASARHAVEGPQNPLPHLNLGTLSATQPHQPLCDCDPVALAEMNAPSHPTPPMALTAQEKLLLRMARPNSPVLLAELDTLHHEAALAREHTQVLDLSTILMPGLSAQSESATPAPPTNDSAPQPATDLSSTAPSTNGDPQ